MSALLPLLFSINIYADVAVSYPRTANPAWVHDTTKMVPYPLEMAQSQITGCAVYQVDIDQDGNTTAVRLVSAAPKAAAFAAATKALKTWHWQPSSAASQAGSQWVRMDFCISQTGNDAVKKQCAIQSQISCQAKG